MWLAIGICTVYSIGALAVWRVLTDVLSAPPEPNYPAIGRAYLAEVDAEARADEPEPQTQGLRWCPACVCQAQEHDLSDAICVEGDPYLCDAHHERLSEWAGLDARMLARAIVGMQRYAERVRQ